MPPVKSSKNLALRVTVNSVGMILAVYFVMQFVSYFRDNLVLGVSDLSGLASSVGGFLAANVLPPTVILGTILFLIALPIQRVAVRLESGEELPPEELEATRVRILGFSKFVLAMNLIGFAAGYVLFQILLGQASALLRFDRLIILASNLAGGAIYAAAQSALDSVAFAPLRERLGIREIGARRREASSSARQYWLALLVVAYVLTFLQFNLRDLSGYHEIELSVAQRVRSGEVAPSAAAEDYRRALSEGLSSFTSRKGVDVAALPLPWDRKGGFAAIQQEVFLLYFCFLALVVAVVQLAIYRERRFEIGALKGRLEEVVAGGGDLRSRLALRSMDDFGELAELVNRLLDEFSRLVSRIAAEAERTKAGADSTAVVVARAEAEATKGADALIGLKDSIEAEAAQSRSLRAALEGLRGSASEAASAAEAQESAAAESSTAMEEMAASIQSVEGMTSRAGALAADLAGQGEAGVGASAGAIAAIREIEAASRLALESVGALDKISSDINLLAMNAAIEAAHAGDRGRGFAVVANEVRGLAAHAAKETDAIRSQIGAMAAKTADGVRRAEESGRLVSQLGRGLAESASVSREIAAAMREQAEGTRSVAAAVGRAAEATKAIRARMAEQGSGVETMSAALGDSLRTLDELAGTSKRQAEGVRELELAFAELRGEVAKNLEAVGALESEVRRFKA
jgi:methyl-accepting chemotaxis protein